MNKEQFGRERIIKTFLEYNQEQLKELLESNGDINLINKKKSNIKPYEKQLEELHKQS